MVLENNFLCGHRNLECCMVITKKIDDCVIHDYRIETQRYFLGNGQLILVCVIMNIRNAAWQKLMSLLEA